MNLIENGVNNKREQQKNKRIAMAILIVIVLLVILCVGLLVAISYFQSLKLKVSIDGVSVSLPQNTIIVQDDDVYVSINDLASYVGYQYNQGSYKEMNQSQNECYVESTSEVTAFTLNSSNIYKKNLTNSGGDYEYLKLPKTVISQNGKMYTNMEGARIGFNISFNYNRENNKVTIYTIPYLVNYYNQTLTTQGYTVATTLNEQKAMLQNLLIVENENRKMGVISITSNSTIINVRFNSIKYSEANKEFFVTTTDGKVGIMSMEGVTRITPTYDELKTLDQDLKLYTARIGNKYGVIDATGRTVIQLEYDQIGVDLSLFPEDDIKNASLLFDNCIPVRKDKQYGLFDKKGQVLLPVEQDGLGYIISTTKDKSINNLLVIPDYEGIVFEKDIEKQKGYGLVNSLGEIIIPAALEEIYSTTSGNKTEYYMRYQGQLMNVTNYLKENGAKDFSENENAQENSNTNTINNTQTNTLDGTNTTGNTENTTNAVSNEVANNVVGNELTNNVAVNNTTQENTDNQKENTTTSNSNVVQNETVVNQQV